MADAFNDPPPFAGSTGLFLSAAPADEAEAARLAAALASYGLPLLPRPTQAERETPAGQERIQRDIQACELFLPVISAHSNASPEGAFRSDWQQAAERAAAKTGSLPFLVPLMAENLSAPAAKVPEPFRAVPWVSLPGPAAETVLVARLQEMLRQHEIVRLRQQKKQVTPVVVPVFAPEPEVAVGPAAPTPTATGFNPLLWSLIAGGVIAVGLIAFFAFRPSSRTAAPAPATMSTSLAPTPTPVPLLAPPSQAEAMHVLLSPTVNLTNDASFDPAARAIDAQLARAFARASGFKIETGAPTPNLADALVAARRANASLVVTSRLTRTAQVTELHTQIFFTTGGVSYGILGPVTVTTSINDATLTEFVDRTTTGIVEASENLLRAPAQLTKVAYQRPWARWPLAQQVRALTALPVSDTERRIAGLTSVLGQDSLMLDARLHLARAFRDAGRYNDADSAFAEIFSRRALISEAELHDMVYDRSMLLGSMPAALAAARERAALWPRSGAIDQLVGSLFALNRPGTAATEFAAWLAQLRPTLTSAEVSRRENESALLETLAHVRHGETAKAQASLTALKQRLGPSGTLASVELESLVFARAGAEADFERLVDRAGELSSAAPLAAMRLAFNLHGQLLHAGRPEDAAHFLERARRLWTARPVGLTTATDIASLLLEVDLNLAQKRPADALVVLDRASPAMIASHSLELDGRRALALQDLGRTGDLSTLLGKLEAIDLRNSHGLPLYWRARLAARAGLHKSAVELLRLAVTNGLWFDDVQHFTTSYGRHEPEFAALRGMSNYDELLRTQN